MNGLDFRPAGISLSQIDRLTSILSVAGDTLIHTSDGTNQTLQWSRSLALLRFIDPTGTPIAVLYPANDSLQRRGLYVNGHMQVGQGTSFWSSNPQANILLNIVEDTNDTWNATDFTGGFSTALQIQPQLNADIAQAIQAYTLAEYSFRLNAGFDTTDGAGGGIPTTLTGANHQILSSLTAPLVGSLSTIIMSNFNVNFSLNGTPTAPTEMNGIRITNLSITNPVPTRTIGIKATGSFSGTTTWGIMASSAVQMNTTNRFYFGGTLTTQGSVYMGRGPSATEAIVAVSGTPEYSYFAASFGPYSAGGYTAKTLGTPTTPWAGIYLTDGGYSTEIITTSSVAMTAARILTIDVQNSARSISLQGNPTLSDWFNQNVKTTADVTHNGLKLGAGGLDLGTGTLPTTTWVVIAAGAAGYSQIQLVSGAAPSSPAAGDIWYDGTYLGIHMGLSIKDGSNITFGTPTGTKIGMTTSQKIAFYGSTPIVQGAALTAAETTITHDAPGTPDYNCSGSVTNIAPYGLSSADEFNTLLQVIRNLQLRVAEIDTRLKASGGLGLWA